MAIRPRIELSDDILRRLRAREDTAYDELIERLGPALVNFAAQILRSTDAAEDIVQEVFYRMWQQGDRLAPKGTVVSYCFTAVRNRAVSELRHVRMAERSHLALAADAQSDERESLMSAADAEMESDENLHRLRLALATLTERQQTAFTLRYGQSMSTAEIAEVLGSSPKGVVQLMMRARQLLRERFFASDKRL